MLVDGLNVGSEVELAAYPGDNGRQRFHIRKSDADFQTLLFRQVSDRNTPDCTVYFDRSQVAANLHHFDSRNCARTQEGEHVFPIVRSAITKAKNDVFPLFKGSAFSTQCPRGAVEELEKSLVESPHAAETGCRCDVRHRHLSVVDQLFGKQHSPGLCNRDGGGAKMLE